jgi:hypothetical protein
MQRGKSAAPRDDLVEDGADRLRLVRGGGELREVLEVERVLGRLPDGDG